jgi:putative ABC transport system substrate-binding protein
MKATSHIPIVFALASEPVATGYVASLARPGGNVTGLSLEAPDLGGKRLGYLRRVVPAAHQLAVLTDIAYLASRLDLDHIKAAAPALGFEPVPVEIRRAEDIEPAFAGLGVRAEAMYVCSADPLVNNNRDRISALALGAKLPTVYAEKAYAEAGGLISYGPNVPDMFRRAAEYADKILKRREGRRPAGGATQHLRARHQSQDRESARADNSGDAHCHDVGCQGQSRRSRHGTKPALMTQLRHEWTTSIGLT